VVKVSETGISRACYMDTETIQTLMKKRAPLTSVDSLIMPHGFRPVAFLPTDSYRAFRSTDVGVVRQNHAMTMEMAGHLLADVDMLRSFWDRLFAEHPRVDRAVSQLSKTGHVHQTDESRLLRISKEAMGGVLEKIAQLCKVT
jgi:hypothetical protein